MVSKMLLAGLLTASSAMAKPLDTPLPSSTSSGVASPAATSSSLPVGTKFSLMALRSASEIHFADFEAAKGSVFLHLPAANATCDDGSDGAATFYLAEDGGLYLYTPTDAPQQLYADRSGMGQGNFGYTTSLQPPRNAELTGWALDEVNDLTLAGAGFLACPNSIDGAWSVWVAAGIANPAGNSDCLGMSVRAVERPTPVSCSYTS